VHLLLPLRPGTVTVIVLLLGGGGIAHLLCRRLTHRRLMMMRMAGIGAGLSLSGWDRLR
jgi:hypothetical protein